MSNLTASSIRRSVGAIWAASTVLSCGVFAAASHLPLTDISAFVNIHLMEWRIVYFSEDVQNTILAFPAGIQARYVHLTERLVAFGPDLGMPHTRAMGKGLFELRMKSAEGIGRVFFCTRSQRRIVMLHAFIKKSAKTPANEVKIARARLKEVNANEDA